MKYVVLRENCTPPSRATTGSAGYDLCACIDKSISIGPHRTEVIPLGFALQVPEGYVGLIFARSGLATKQGLAPANKVGVIDSDYRGEWMVPLHNHSDTVRSVLPKERIAQMVIVPCLTEELERVDTLEDTDRGVGGFGSTGL